MGYIADIVVVLLVVAITIIAISKGFLKTLFGLLSSILIIVIAVFAASPLTGAIANGTDWDEKLESSIHGSLVESKVPNAYGEIMYYDLDGDGVLDLAFSPENSEEKKPYDKVFEGSTYGLFKVHKLLRKTAEANLNKDDPSSSITVVSAMAKMFTMIVFLVSCFLAIAIVGKIIMVIISKLLLKAVQNLYFVHFVDKLLGGVFGFALAVLIILIIMAILQAMHDLSFMDKVNEYIEGTAIVKFIRDNNFLYDLFAKNVNMDKISQFFSGGKK